MPHVIATTTSVATAWPTEIAGVAIATGAAATATPATVKQPAADSAAAAAITAALAVTEQAAAAATARPATEAAAAAHRRNAARSPAAAAPAIVAAKVGVQRAVVMAIVGPKCLSIGLADAPSAIAAAEGIGGMMIEVVVEPVPQLMLAFSDGHGKTCHGQRQDQRQ